MLVDESKITRGDLIEYKIMLANLEQAHDLLIKCRIPNGISYVIMSLSDAIIENDFIYDINYKEHIYFKNIFSLCSTLKKNYEE